MIRSLFILICLATIVYAQSYAPANERPPMIAREFRSAWVATAYNIDWPSSKGLSASQQQAEVRAILDRLKSLKMNAVILQVRPMGDAFYESSIEPWSHFLTGTMGRSPGYDPLAYWVKEAHSRGIEVHAWFNPFRALCNNSEPASSEHITRSKKHLTKRYGSMTWIDPSLAESRSHALKVILDVVRRYDIDGVHLDDYFYPYPKKGLQFSDGKSPAQRRAYIDDFVSNLYRSVKEQKPWVRVGISPFGIWRPGVPSGIEAGLDSYEELAGDSLKWLNKSWVDYLAPQLYWPIQPRKQSFSLLLDWWRNQGTRPVWPGIATERIGGPEDRRPASEITQQIALTRKIGKNWNGHLHWSMKSLMTNKGGISSKLSEVYTQPAAIPPMPWIKNTEVKVPRISASANGSNTQIRWSTDNDVNHVAIQARYGKSWKTVSITAANRGNLNIPKANAIAVTAIDRYGNMSPPKVLVAR